MLRGVTVLPRLALQQEEPDGIQTAAGTAQAELLGHVMACVRGLQGDESVPDAAADTTSSPADSTSTQLGQHWASALNLHPLQESCSSPTPSSWQRGSCCGTSLKLIPEAPT